ncbi:MAG: sulfite exporter TauE/SafE family protein [Candidatus Limnocylindrales bacterium]
MEIGLFMVVGGMTAGIFGSLLGLGGGVLIVPLLTLGFGLPLREAVGVSLVCVIMTSSAAAGVYLERHVANLRLGMTLELFTATGALVGSSIAFLLDERLLSGLFAALLLYVAVTMFRSGRRATAASATLAPATEDLGPIDVALPPIDVAPGALPPPSQVATGPAPIHGLRIGMIGSFGAGIVSALLGIGGGIIKVPLMHLGMGVPLRVATATSNLMIGITAAASAVIYALHGGIDPYVAGPTAIGVFVGATAGSRLAHRIDLRYLRWLFVVVLGYTAIQMLIKALG